MKVFIINGSGGNGKDTFVEFCTEYVHMNSDITVHNMSTVDIIKQAAKLLGLTSKARPEDRKFLSDLKDLATEYSDHSTNYVLGRIEEIRSSTENHVAFVHCREPKEIAKLIERLAEVDVDVETILVRRKTAEKYTNHADLNVENANYMHVLENNSTLDYLSELAAVFCDTHIILQELV